MSILAAAGSIALASCTTTPEALLPSAVPAPEPAVVQLHEPALPELPALPEPAPAPVLLGHAPLVGTRWEVERIYGDMRRLSPAPREMWIEFQDTEDTLYVRGPYNTMSGIYAHQADLASPRESFDFEEGTLVGDSIVHQRRPGSFSELEDMLIENLNMLKGYYIAGQTPEESRLTIWGGYRSEEVILMELKAVFDES